MNPSRIAYVLKIFPKLSETFIVNELAELRRRGIQLRILSLLPPRDELRQNLFVEAGLHHVTCYEPARFPAVLEEFRPELVHAHFATESAEMARALANKRRLPYTFTSHGYDIYRKPPPDYAKRAMAAAAVITVSRANATYIAENFGVPESHVRVIPCGVDLDRFRPPPQRRNGDVPLVVCVARQVAVKNLALLLRSCAVLHRRAVPFRCVMIGDGPLRQQLQALRSRLGLSESVLMPGAAEQSVVLDYLQHAAVGVLTSDSEGMPVSLMEAAACGLAVVATAVGGVPELVKDGTTGFLCPPGAAEALATALERLLVNAPLRTAMGAAARARAQSMFSLQTQVDQLLHLWSSILSGEGT